MRVRVIQLLLLALAALLAGCSYDSLADVRFTYSVLYSVESSDPASATTPNVTYLNEAGGPENPGAVALPWSIELPAMSYDYDHPYYATLAASAAGLAAGESIAVTIALKDYRTGFETETLARQTVTDAGTGGTPLDVALVAPELPLTR